MQVSEEKIQQIQQNILHGMREEDAQMQEIEMLSESITNRLVSKGHTVEKFMGTTYIWNLNYDKSAKRITVMRTDPIKLNIGNGHYKPGIFTGEWDFNFTFEENVFMVVKAALCSKAGLVPVEEMN